MSEMPQKQGSEPLSEFSRKLPTCAAVELDNVASLNAPPYHELLHAFIATFVPTSTRRPSNNPLIGPIPSTARSGSNSTGLAARPPTCILYKRSHVCTLRHSAVSLVPTHFEQLSLDSLATWLFGPLGRRSAVSEPFACCRSTAWPLGRFTHQRASWR